MLLKENDSLNLQWPANYKNLSLKLLKKVAVLNCKERFREADALTSMRLISFGWRKAWTMQTSEQFYPWNIWLTSKFIQSKACNLTKKYIKNLKTSEEQLFSERLKSIFLVAYLCFSVISTTANHFAITLKKNIPEINIMSPSYLAKNIRFKCFSNLLQIRFKLISNSFQIHFKLAYFLIFFYKFVT